MGRPPGVLPALIEVISKFAAGGFPGPTQRYTRTPTRLTTTTPVLPTTLRTSAQMTAKRSPGAASLATLKVRVTTTFARGLIARVPRSTAIQVVRSLTARSAPNVNDPSMTAAAAG